MLGRKILSAINTIRETLQSIKSVQDEHQTLIKSQSSGSMTSVNTPTNSSGPVMWATTLANLDVYFDKDLTNVANHSFSKNEIIQLQNPVESDDGSYVFETYYFDKQHVKKGFVCALTEDDEYVTNLSFTPIKPSRSEFIEI